MGIEHWGLLCIDMTTLMEKGILRNILSKKLSNQQMTEKRLMILHPNLVTSLVLHSHTHTASVSAGCDCFDWTGRTSEASLCCFGWSLHSCKVHVSKSFSVYMEKFDLPSVTEPCGPPALIVIQMVEGKSMKCMPQLLMLHRNPQEFQTVSVLSNKPV